MATFLLKTEPTEYSFDDLLRDGRARWDGITNHAALAHLRTARAGDEALIYHTGEERAIVGLARIIGDPFPDPARPEKALAGAPRFAVVDLAPVKKARAPATLAAIKADPRFCAFALVRQGRLSVMTVPPDLDRVLRRLCGL